MMKKAGSNETHEYILFINNTQSNGIAEFYKCIIFGDRGVVYQ